jgi:molybdopterin-containing oxidoreductase family membrane subunit
MVCDFYRVNRRSYLPPKKIAFSNVACLLSIVGIWIEKGPGMVVSGFVPTPLGEIVEYFPTLDESLICIGVWAFGILIYSWLVHLAIPILSGTFRHRPRRDQMIT